MSADVFRELKDQMKKGPVAIFLLPRKSFTRIVEEYGIEFTEEDARLLAGAIGRERTDGEKLVEEAVRLAERKGILQEEREMFVKDVVRATLFYVDFLRGMGDLKGGS